MRYLTPYPSTVVFGCGMLPGLKQLITIYTIVGQSILNRDRVYFVHTFYLLCVPTIGIIQIRLEYLSKQFELFF